MSSNDPIVQAIEGFSSCDVSDALLKLNHPHGGFLSNITLWSPERQAGSTKVIGPAYTVRYVLKADVDAPKLDGHYIDSIPPGAVVFVSAPPKIINAVYGGLMTHRAMTSGAVATMVDGRVRDLQEHRQMNYPVFARDIGTAAPYEVVRVSEINVPVKLQSDEQDAVIKPGDYLIGDLNGVVCLPKELAEKAIPLLGSQVEADEKIALELDGGMAFTEASKKHRGGLRKA